MCLRLAQNLVYSEEDRRQTLDKQSESNALLVIDVKVQWNLQMGEEAYVTARNGDVWGGNALVHQSQAEKWDFSM